MLEHFLGMLPKMQRRVEEGIPVSKLAFYGVGHHRRGIGSKKCMFIPGKFRLHGMASIFPFRSISNT
jgi:hypothetical protein